MNNDAFPRGLFFLAGAATGFALGMYLASDKGSALREQLSGYWDQLVDTLGDRAEEKMQELLARLDDLLENGALLLENLEAEVDQEIEETGGELREFAEDAEHSFESGMDRARARLQQKFVQAGLQS
ncbi:MAG: YtxH domain-containing protein [Saprospiraceae bacterium]|nr:YtxH domain-containing protein [Saprospiraceae bacterium]